MSLFLLKFFTQLSREFLRRLAYGSVVGALLVKLVVSSSGWKAAGAAFAQADMAAAEFIGSLLPGHTGANTGKVVVVAIDDEAYGTYFNAQSPLDRQTLQSIISDMLKVLPLSTVLMVDLDVSPHRVGSQKKPSDTPDALDGLDGLDAFWIANKNRLVLVHPVNPKQTGSEHWVDHMQKQGVRLGKAVVPQNFGLIDFKHDVPDSLSAQANQLVCPACELPSPATTTKEILTRVASDHAVLANPTTVAWRADTTALLRALSPKVVVLGGTWGIEDTFQTPFGTRYGAQLHAAKVAGHLNHHRTVPPYAQVLMAIFVAALSVTMARFMANGLAKQQGVIYKPGFVLGQRGHTNAPSSSGASPQWGILPDDQLHKLQMSATASFMAGSFKRLLVLLGCMLVLLSVFGALAFVHHVGGVWFPSFIAMGFGVFAVTAAWITDITRILQIETPIIVIKPSPFAGLPAASAGVTGPVLLPTAPLGVRLQVEPVPSKDTSLKGQWRHDLGELKKDFILPLQQARSELQQHLNDLLMHRQTIGWHQPMTGVGQILMLFALRVALPAWAFISLLY